MSNPTSVVADSFDPAMFDPAMQGIHIPAMRGAQGDRTMFLLLVTNNVLMRNFAAEAEVDTTDGRVQRTFDKRHAGDIVTYITENASDYVLGAMTYAVDNIDERHFKPVAPGSNLGTLILPMDAQLRCLDGQHRRQALHDAALQDKNVLFDYSAVVLYVEDDFAKRRQMFSDMNATPKVVSKALNITFDTRDPYARAAQQLAVEHPLLHDVVELTKARISSSEPKFFSLAGVYDGLKRYQLGMVLPRGRSPKDVAEEELFKAGIEMFDVLDSARPELGSLKRELDEQAGPKEKAEVMKRFRSKSILASTTTLRVIAGALHAAMDRDGEDDVNAYTKSLSRVDFAPSSLLFTDDKVNFVGRGGTPSARNQEVFAATRALADALHRI